MARLFGHQAKKRERRDELLSAYLDGQLSAEERARLEAQLTAEPALRAELEALRHTVALVRGLPPVPIPRNFILPQTAAARPRPAVPVRPRRAWAAPLLTAATGVVSLLFMVVLAGNLLLPHTRGNLAFAPAAAPLPEIEAPQAAVEPSPPSQKAATEEVEEIEPAYAGAPTPLSLATEAPAEEAPPRANEAEGHDEATPEEWDGMAEATPGEMTEAPPPTGGGGPTVEATIGTPTATPPVAEEPAAAPTTPITATLTTEEDRDSVEPTPGAVSEAVPLAGGEEDTVAAEDEQATLEDERSGLFQVTLWLVLESVLGLTALGLALATILAWRARRR